MGEVAPDFEIPLLDSGELSSVSAHSGDVVLIDFWATTCPPCRRSMPDIERFAQQYADDGLVLMSVNVDMPDPERETLVRSFLEAQGIEHDVLLDNGRASYAYQVRRIPLVVLIDDDGTIGRVYQGFTEPNVIRRAIEDLTGS